MSQTPPSDPSSPFGPKIVFDKLPNTEPINSPLSTEQFAELEKAKVRGAKVRRVASIATTDAVLSAIFAIACLMFTCMGIENLVLGAALSVVAYNSFRGATRLKAKDAGATRFLALNQLFLAACIIAYALWSMWQVAYGKSGMFAASADPMLSDPSIDSMVPPTLMWIEKNPRQIGYIFYGLLILGTLLFQGLTALYYYTRRKVLQEYLDNTPAWVTDLQRRTVGH